MKKWIVEMKSPNTRISDAITLDFVAISRVFGTIVMEIGRIGNLAGIAGWLAEWV